MAGRPVGAAFPIFTMPSGMTNWDIASDGTIRVPDNPADRGGHAVCIVGFQPDRDEATQGGWFIFRNSGSEDFAPRPFEGKPGDGYGRISLKDIVNHCWDFFRLPPGSPAAG